MLDKFGWFKNYDTSGIITAQDIVILGKKFTSPLEMYFVILVVVTVLTVLAVNMARVMGLAPVVGVPLPLVSYGGSSLLVLMVAFGLLQSAHVHKPRGVI